MSWSFNIGSVAGTAIRLHVTFLLFLVWILFGSYASGGTEQAWHSLTFTVLLFVCVVAHEFGHIFMARQFGVVTPAVTLLPIGGVAQLERIPENPWQEFLVAVAGPAVNIVIAAVLVLFFDATLDKKLLADIDNSASPLQDRLALANTFLVLFNMIPAFPMDGGRVLRAALATRCGYVRATEIAATIGQCVAFFLGFLGLFGNPLLIFIAIFVYLAAASEAQLVAIRAMSRDVPTSAAMMTRFSALQPDTSINAAIELLLRTNQSEFPVVDLDGRPVGILGRIELIKALKERGPNAQVADAMTNPFPTVGHSSRLDEAFRALQEQNAPAVGVVDAEGRLKGLVTPETIAEMLMVHESMPDGVPLGPWSR